MGQHSRQARKTRRAGSTTGSACAFAGFLARGGGGTGRRGLRTPWPADPGAGPTCISPGPSPVCEGPSQAVRPRDYYE
jgi:hypothetical protein